MKVLITGSSGLIGSALIPVLQENGHQIVRLVRSKDRVSDSATYWNPEAGEIDTSRLEGMDAVVHLAGENVASGRWTKAKMARIRDSRVIGTRLLSESLARLDQPPGVLACASAVGYYGSRGDEELEEESAPGAGFLAEACREWEAATEPAAEKGIRVVNLRFGVVLSQSGGALAKMLFPFRMGCGGIIGGGKQYWSWIAEEDAVRAIHHVLVTEALSGAVNVVAPYPVRNRAFTRTLGGVLRRPTVFPLPAFAARLALGRMADVLLLASARVVPKRLLSSGYEFRFPHLEVALRHLLGK